MSNGRQLFLGLHMHADDYNEWLPPNEQGNFIGQNKNSWLSDDIRTADATNTALLSDPSTSELAPYVAKSTRIYKCPGDKRTWTDPGGTAWPRVRTYAMNEAVGSLSFALGPTDAWDLNWPSGHNYHNNPWRTYGKFRDMV